MDYNTDMKSERFEVGQNVLTPGGLPAVVTHTVNGLQGTQFVWVKAKQYKYSRMYSANELRRAPN